VLGNAFFVLNKLYCITGFATGKAVVGVGIGVNFAAWFIVGVEGAEDLVVPIEL